MADVSMEDTAAPAAAKEASGLKKEASKEEGQTAPEPHKLPPCDQCRRRKVKCDGIRVPCERCVCMDLARILTGPI
jgi:hypothetical protein